VLQGGEVVGRTPLIIRYPWGSTDKLKLEAEGYETILHDLTAKGDKPPHEVTVSLAPKPLWVSPVSANVRVPPLAVGSDVLAMDRRGGFALYDGKTGAVLWLKNYPTLEGVRGLPAYSRGTLFVPHIDGRLLFLSAAKGEKIGELTLPRLKGDAAAVGGRTAVMTADGTCVLLEGQHEVSRIALGATPAAGVVAAHGAFWIGTIDGSVIRIEASTGLRRDMRITTNRAAIDGIGADTTGVYATTAHGSLVALDTGGGERWRHDKIGDIVGAPARAGDCVGVAARDGIVTIYDAKSGTMLRRYEGVGRPRSGLLGVGPTLLLLRADGSLWACDAESGTVLVDAKTPAGALFPPAILPGDRVALPQGTSNEATARAGAAGRPRRPARGHGRHARAHPLV
jgi:outer membrane protein assembly factor BamB